MRKLEKSNDDIDLNSHCPNFDVHVHTLSHERSRAVQEILVTFSRFSLWVQPRDKAYLWFSLKPKAKAPKAQLLNFFCTL